MKEKSKKAATKQYGEHSKNKKAAKKHKKLRLAKEQESKIERSMSVASSLRSSKVKHKKHKSVSEDAELLKKRSRSVSDDSEEEYIDDEDEDTLSSVTGTLDDDDAVSEDEDDTDSDDDDSSDEDELTLIEQIQKCDPGPEVTDVECGFNCGSCEKFVPLNDPRREDSEWLTRQLNRKAKTRCPYLFPEELDVAEGKVINDYIMRADTHACEQFRFNERRASTDLASVIELIRSKVHVGELAILQFQIESTRKLKKESASNGYELGEKVPLRLPVQGSEKLVMCEVVDYQRKKGAEVIVRPITNDPGVPRRVAIAARRVASIEEA